MKRTGHRVSTDHYRPQRQDKEVFQNLNLSTRVSVNDTIIRKNGTFSSCSPFIEYRQYSRYENRLHESSRPLTGRALFCTCCSGWSLGGNQMKGRVSDRTRLFLFNYNNEENFTLSTLHGCNILCKRTSTVR